MKADYQEIQKAVDTYPTKYKKGFIRAEISDLLEKLNINESRFNKAMGVNTCMVIDGNVITYHVDVIKGIVCAIEGRLQNSIEWD
jgi:hypothetical protein